MDIFHFHAQGPDKLSAPPTTRPDEGFVWIDALRGEEGQAIELVQQLMHTPLHDHHVSDLNNTRHPSYYDATADYELILFRHLSPSDLSTVFEGHTLALLLSDRLLLTVRPQGLLQRTRQNLLDGQIRIPKRPVGLMHLLLNACVNQLLAHRAPLTQQIGLWRESLVEARDPFGDWHEVLAFGSQLRRLGLVCSEQHDALESWQANTPIEIDEHLQVRLNDLKEHIRRLETFAQHQQADIESMVQLHFSAVAHRTNEIMRVLTVISAIFLPLSLVAGIFGMNFEYMPELKFHWGYFIALAAMGALGSGLFLLFKIKRWV